MRLPSYLTPTLLLILTTHLALPTSAARSKPSNAILLSTVNALTLRANLKTTHRRVAPVPQLKCLGPACKHHTIDVLRCRNAGADYSDEDIQWTCTANLPEEFKLGSTDVICEGYDNSDDPYVLKGSCGVEYRLVLTDLGEEKFGRGGGWSPGKGGDWDDGETGGTSLGGILFVMIFVGVLGWIIYSACLAAGGRVGGGGNNAPWGGGGGGGGGGWGGGGGSGGDDPPPPYDYNSGPSSKQQSGWGLGGGAPAAGQQGWRPGFWSGALGGAAAGYMAGNRGSAETRNTWGGYNNNGEGSSRGPRGGGPSSAGSSGSSSFSSAPHESTGFGSTSRR
ncbi:hypothetical protein MMC09_002760 [Bachmanniomyces sp. S44760]|nr:hypothetical protein [Bachmanniomyces sp. S44760]